MIEMFCYIVGWEYTYKHEKVYIISKVMRFVAWVLAKDSWGQ